MSEQSARDRWTEDRTTFQRVYDLLVGTEEFLSASAFADRAECSDTAARQALVQFEEMGIAQRRDGRPATYRRNESYLRWKRIESLAREHTAEKLRERLDDLIERDESFQTAYGVPDPDAVSPENVPVDDHETMQEQFDDLGEWRTVRRDIRILRRAIQRAASTANGTSPI